MFPAILLAHWKIGQLNRQWIHRHDFDATSKADLENELRLFIREEIAAARHLWSSEYPFAEFTWKIHKISRIKENGTDKALIQIVVSVAFP